MQADYVPLAPSRDADRPDSRPSSCCRSRRRTASATSPALRSTRRCPTRSARSSTGWCTRAAGRSAIGAAAPMPVQAGHVCLLFRRFVSFGTDMTRGYVDALEARGVKHLLVGGRAFHGREEIETIRAALAAIEWPDDELSVFATLRGRALRDRRRGAARVPPHVRSPLSPVPRPGRPAVAPRADRRRLAVCWRPCTRSGTGGRWPTRLPRCSTRRARTSASRCAAPASRCWPTCCTWRNWRASTSCPAGCRSAASSTSCARRPSRARPPRRRSSKTAATACA